MRSRGWFEEPRLVLTAGSHKHNRYARCGCAGNGRGPRARHAQWRPCGNIKCSARGCKVAEASIGAAFENGWGIRTAQAAQACYQKGRKGGRAEVPESLPMGGRVR